MMQLETARIIAEKTAKIAFDGEYGRALGRLKFADETGSG
jgi:hypothetical protein